MNKIPFTLFSKWKWIKKEDLLKHLHRYRMGSDHLQRGVVFGDDFHLLLKNMAKSTKAICPDCNSRPSPMVYFTYDVGDLLPTRRKTGIHMFLVQCSKCKKLFLYVKDFKIKRRR